MISQIPEFLRELREFWLEGVPNELQSHIRFNANISREKGIPIVTDFLSGGGGTMIEQAVDEELYQALEQLVKQEYFPREYDSQAYRNLAEFLHIKGVTLSLGIGFGPQKETDIVSRYIPKGVFETTKRVYELLPEHHLRHAHFRELRIGGWSGGDAKGSQYKNPVVHLFDFIMRGAIRNYIGLLLHETGHAHFELLRKTQSDLAKRIVWCFGEICSTEDPEIPFMIDYLYGTRFRTQECMFDCREFAAEAYLIYVVRGTTLRDSTASLPRRSRKPWQKLYDTFRQSFGGIEYE